MKKKVISLLLAIIIFIPVVSLRAADLINVEDTAMSYTAYTNNIGLVRNLDSTASNPPAIPFQYEIPSGGATVVIFFNATGKCRNSSDLISGLENTLWAQDDRFNIVAVECMKQSRETVKSFMDEYDRMDIVDHTYYNPNSNAVIAWYLESISRGGDMSGSLSFSVSVVFAHVLIITEVNGVPTIRYSIPDAGSVSLITSLLGSVADIPEGKDTTVNVKITGTMRYNYVRESVVCLNEKRAEAGAPPLTLSAELTELAMTRAAECAVYYDHFRPNGYTCFSIGNGNGAYSTGLILAENIASGFPTPDRIVNRWMRSEKHKINILKPNHTQVGVGCCYHNGLYYWVNLFGDGSDTSPLGCEEEIEADYTVETLESRLTARPEARDITLSCCGSTDCMGLNRNIGIDPYYTYQTMIYPRPAAALTEDGRAIAHLGSDGILHGVTPGEGTLSVELYAGDPLAEQVHVTVTDHNWDEGFVTAEPTYKNSGETFYTCRNCGATKTEVVPRLISTFKGDVDGDGKITAKDLLKLRKYLAIIDDIDAVYLPNADVNGDGKVTAKDILLLRKYMAGIVTEL